MTGNLQSSLAVEGELPEDGLAAYSDDGDDLMMALARKIISGEEEAESVEEAFAQALDAESEAEELLVDLDWRPVEIEPKPVAVNGNGHRDVLMPTVELVPVIGHNVNGANGNSQAPVQVPRNGYQEEADEPQRSLFSWAEFMAAEPVKPRRRSRKPQAATASLFEWALTLEQERGKELVGAGR